MSHILSSGTARSSLTGFLHEVYTGLDRGELFVVHQPVVDVERHRLDGFEALVRWAHPRDGLLGPDAFVPLLESSGHLQALTRFVLRAACRTAASWPALGGTHPRVRVNVPVGLLGDPRLLHDIDGALEDTGLDPARLVVEVTETGILPDVLAAQVACRDLRARGIAVALDDVGTGDCDAARLALLDVDEVKLDRSMVRGLPGDTARLADVAQVLAAAAAAGLQVTVEGIERPDQLSAVRAVGGRLLQGFYFGRPRVLEGAEHVRVLDRRCRTLLDARPDARRPAPRPRVALPC
jgi:EAL domain-containing protein (putative c-di-GMP-specific phosphodiesterase class I)